MRRHRLLLALLALGLLATSALRAGGTPEAGAVTTAQERPPNIVFILADDLSWDLVRHMPQVRAMQREGMTFRQFVVADSLCCSSRATILTGQFPHNTRVLGNTAPLGGYRAWARHGARRRSVAIALREAGYRTGLMGKYLNGYMPTRSGVDPGWDTWWVPGLGYKGFNYLASVDGRAAAYGNRRRHYLTDVLARRAVRFVRGDQPFFLLVSTFAPHSPYTPAPRHRRVLGAARLPAGRAFGARVSHAPTWLGSRRPLGARTRARLRGVYVRRARAVQAVDELVGRVRARLDELGIADETYLVFGSDNGYHLGQHRLTTGKRTAFDHDIRVPYVVVGPGVRRGASMRALAGTVDLAPTFEAWAGLEADPRRDGRSLAPLLDGRAPRWWRHALPIEHTHPEIVAGDPDVQGWRMGMPPSYRALRTARTTYVEYANGDREFYDRRRDPGELRNRARRLSPLARARLNLALDRYERCAGGAECWAAGRR